MNTFMQIVTLQNSTFNVWAWVIGTIILLIIAGMNFDEDPPRSIIFGFFALIWPLLMPVLIGMGLLALPFWVGIKINDFVRNKV